MRAQGSNGAQPPGYSDRDVWRRSQQTDTSRDEAEILMDLAAFADNRLDPDETARVEALIVDDAGADADIAAARLLAGTAMAAADPAIIGRALRVNGMNHIVVGIFPRSFNIPPAADAWLPEPPAAK